MSDSAYSRYSNSPPPKGRQDPFTNLVGSFKSTSFKSAGRRRGSVSTVSSKDTTKMFLEPPAAHSYEQQQQGVDNTELKFCENCELEQTPVWNCSNCGMNFCDPCWDKQGPHKLGRTGQDGLPHEKEDPRIVKRLREILSPPQDDGEQQTLHADDEDTKWFGMGRNSHNAPVLQDYGRYSAIMAESHTGMFKSRFPHLISFIGQTGAGKSTLIKMLIDQQEHKASSTVTNLPSPVAGTAANGNMPTSGDVHLYSDPNSYHDEHPLLYADCEGLEGGENEPMAAQYRNQPKKDHSSKHHRKRKLVSKRLHVVQRDIKWANTQQTLKRQYAVEELYPRLLYTFSDVIVFVLRNAKTFEATVLSMLINWASTSHEKSLNQPTLPHAVIAINATESNVNKAEWDPEYATNILMSNVATAIDRNPWYRELRDYWTSRGWRIDTTRDLLERYYSSITVVRIPRAGRYMMINTQVKKLHEVIVRLCAESYVAKKRSRMLFNSENLNTYLQCAFDHFSQDLTTPFNFTDISFKINPIALDFGGNILKLAAAMKSQYNDPRKLFNHLSQMVASCILLDCVRHSFKGTPDEDILEEWYMDQHCDPALENFCAIFWPCAFKSRKGDRCVNNRESHIKGHQNHRGSIIGNGAYEASFTFDDFKDEWFNLLKTDLKRYHMELTQMMLSRADETVLAAKLHRTKVNTFYERGDGAWKYLSQSTCFCCLGNLAEHPLPCGHVLCTPCIRDYGQPHKELPGSYKVFSCPLHDHHAIFNPPAEVYFKPPLAGLRVLSLDGGGMRGIVILEVLRQVQSELGKIHVQDFFDLIVGTSTGGILALALGVKDWSVDRCVTLFTGLVDKAFTRKFLGGVALGATKYRTRPLEEALQVSFKEEAIFGGRRDTSAMCRRKVAVTSAKGTAEEAVIFTNYNRVADKDGNYQLVRPDNPLNDVTIWEAARATSAAPTYFKPFKNSRTNEAYIDGAMYHNNPVKIAVGESKLLWRDSSDQPPDIFLSIGTGYHDEGTGNGAAHDSKRGQLWQMMHQSKPAAQKKRSAIELRGIPEWRSLWTIFKSRAENVIDAELAWKEFHIDVPKALSDRYIRINPRTKKPTPNLDDKAQIGSLHEEIKTTMTSNNMPTLVLDIARRLIASSFYFERLHQPRPSGGRVLIQGSIQCRFAAGSDNMRHLGRYFAKLRRKHFQPYFRIQEGNNDSAEQTVDLAREVVRDMTEGGQFCLMPIDVRVTSEESVVTIELFLAPSDQATPTGRHGYTISGFPRQLASRASSNTSTTPASSSPDIPRKSSRRRALRRVTPMTPINETGLKSPVSDSGVNYASHERTASITSSLDLKPAHSAGDAERRPPQPPRPLPVTVQSMPHMGHSVLPLQREQPCVYGGQSNIPTRDTRDTVPRSSAVAQWGEFHHNDVEKHIAEALRRSTQPQPQYAAQPFDRPPLIRTPTGTDEDELRMVLERSLYEQ